MLLVRVHLITAESSESRRLRYGRLIQFPQLTMPLIAALTPPEHEVSHTDEIVDPVRFDVPADLVGITAPTPSALHAYKLAGEFRGRGVPVVIGGPHATALPEEAERHADAVVVGEAEDTWPRILEDARTGKLQRVYVSTRRAPLAGMPAPRWDLIKGRRYGRSVTIATRGCPHRCDYCSIPLLYGPGPIATGPSTRSSARWRRARHARSCSGTKTSARARAMRKSCSGRSRRSTSGGRASAPPTRRATRSSSSSRRGADARRSSWASSRSRRRVSRPRTRDTTASTTIAA